MAYTIRKLILTNFRSFKRAEIKIEGSAFITGYNGQGKTSIAIAIQELLIGRSFDAEGLNIPGDELIRTGADMAEISMWLDIWEGDKADTLILNLNVKRDKNGSAKKTFTITRDDGSPRFAVTAAKELRQELFSTLGTSARHAEIAIATHAYLFGREDFDGPLVEMLSADVSADDVFKDATHGERLRAFVNTHKLEIKTLGDLARVGDAAFTLRTDAKKRRDNVLKGITATIEPPRTPDGKKELTVADIPALENGIATLQQSRDALLIEKGRVPGRSRADIEAELSAAGDKLPEAKALVEQARERYAASQSADVPASAQSEELLRAYQDATQAHDDAVRARRTLDDDVRYAERDKQAYTERLRQFDGDGDCHCPTCATKISAKARKELVAKTTTLLVEVDDKIAAIKATFSDADALVETRQKARDSAKKSLEDNRDLINSQRADGRQKAFVEFTTAQQTVGDLEATINACTEEIKNLKTDAPNGAPDVDAIDAEIASLNSRIDAAKKKVEVLEEIRRRDALQQGADNISAEVDFLDWCVKEFKHGEYQNKAVGAHLSDFNSKIAETMQRFGYGLELIATADGLVPMLSRGDTRTKLRFASKGERVMACLAVALTFQPEGLVIVDDVDGLDGQNKAHVMRALAEIEHDGSLIFIAALSTKQEPDFEAAANYLYPASFIWVNDGQVKTFFHEQSPV